MGPIKRFSRAVKRAWFNWGSRSIVRNDRILRLPPKVKGRQLIMKNMAARPEYERVARNVAERWHSTHLTKRYTLRLSKRSPSIKGYRVERFEDYPTLQEILAKPSDPRIASLLRENNVTWRVFRRMVAEALIELRLNMRIIQKKHEIFIDDNVGNFLVRGVRGKKIDLVMVDG